PTQHPRPLSRARAAQRSGGAGVVHATAAMSARIERVMPVWLLLLFVIAFTANLLAGWTTRLTIDLMRGLSPLAMAVREKDLVLLPYWQTAAYVLATIAILLYLRPVIAWF